MQETGQNINMDLVPVVSTSGQLKQQNVFSLSGELWLGLDHISSLISTGKWELEVDLVDWDGKGYKARYGNFKVGS